jgi:hypothetical protein
MVVESGEARGDIGGENGEENWKGRKRGTKSSHRCLVGGETNESKRGAETTRLCFRLPRSVNESERVRPSASGMAETFGRPRMERLTCGYLRC